MKMHEWERVAGEYDDEEKTYRMRVPGGWIYRTVFSSPVGYHYSSVFVPNPITTGRLLGTHYNFEEDDGQT